MTARSARSPHAMQRCWPRRRRIAGLQQLFLDETQVKRHYDIER